jgi:dienelactone hydrolase
MVEADGRGGRGVSAVRRLAGRLVVVLVFVTAACGDGGGGGRDAAPAVREQTISDRTTQDILVFRPSGSGSWPIVMAYHGSNGNAEQMAELGRRLAATGLVVFAPDVRTDVSTEQGIVNTANDSECAYRYARSVASHLGGDLDRPVTFVGWSFGANFALQGGLDEDLDPSHQFISCFTNVPRPDVVVALDGCHYEFAGRPSTLLDREQWGNPGVHLVLAAGSEDTVCPAAQSEKMAAELRTRGYTVQYELLQGADHFAPVFLADGDSGTVPSPDSRAGDRTVDLITTAIADDER